jgi:two-component system, OmpR family, response regulator MprA
MRRVLIVDDDPDVREMLRTVLEWDGYTVETANDGVAALEILTRTDETWLVLLDINMPRMNGLEVCSHLAALDRSSARHLVVLMTAGFFPDGDMPPPVRALLAKPFNLDTLQDLVAKLTNVGPDGDDVPEFRVTPTIASDANEHARPAA